MKQVLLIALLLVATTAQAAPQKFTGVITLTFEGATLNELAAIEASAAKKFDKASINVLVREHDEPVTTNCTGITTGSSVICLDEKTNMWVSCD